MRKRKTRKTETGVGTRKMFSLDFSVIVTAIMLLERISTAAVAEN